MATGERLPVDLWAKQRATDIPIFVQSVHHERRMRGETEPKKYTAEDWDALFRGWLMDTGRVALPTVAELEAILNAEDDIPAHATVAEDGSVQIEPAPSLYGALREHVLALPPSAPAKIAEWQEAFAAKVLPPVAPKKAKAKR